MDLVDPDIFNRDPRDHYDLLQRLGGGTYGEVFKVRKPLGLRPPQRIFRLRLNKGQGARGSQSLALWRDTEKDSAMEAA